MRSSRRRFHHVAVHPMTTTQIGIKVGDSARVAPLAAWLLSNPAFDPFGKIPEAENPKP